MFILPFDAPANVAFETRGAYNIWKCPWLCTTHIICTEIMLMQKRGFFLINFESHPIPIPVVCTNEFTKSHRVSQRFLCCFWVYGFPIWEANFSTKFVYLFAGWVVMRSITGLYLNTNVYVTLVFRSVRNDATLFTHFLPAVSPI
jgi:hypothetical protein